MNKDFWKRLYRLEELAGKIPVVEWYHISVGKDRHAVFSKNKPEAVIALTCLDEDGTKIGMGEKTSDYIAAANPTMVLEMIAEMRKMWRLNNWDVAALQAYGALPEDMEVHIENESFAWHLNRIKTGLGKRLKLAEKRLEDCLLLNDQLEKEADWLADILSAICHDEENSCAMCPSPKTPCTAIEANSWREAARKAVSEANNA